MRTHHLSPLLLLNQPRTAAVIGATLQVGQLLDSVLEVAQDICRKAWFTLGMTHFQICLLYTSDAADE